MAVDEALAQQVAAGASPPTLRFFCWRPPCLSLGFNQPYAVVDEAFCRENGVDITRRPTGGRAVLHHLELTYSVTAPLAVEPFSRELQACYRLICGALVRGLQTLGIPAQVVSEGGLRLPPTSAAPCFISPAAGEVVVGGRKLVGSAMRRWGDVLLQHGSLLLDWDARLQAGVLGLSSDAPLRSAVATVREVLGRVPEGELVDALVAGFAAVLGVALVPGSLTPEEQALASRLARQVYGCGRFIRHRQREEGTSLAAGAV